MARGVAFAAAALALLAACDQGRARDVPEGIGPPLHVLSANTDLPFGGALEVAFDRLLLPVGVVRQTFVLQDLRGVPFVPAIAYDPVARIVTITPDSELAAGQTVRLTMLSPKAPDDPNGLRAIDGAELDPAQPSVLLFVVGPRDGGLGPPDAKAVSFCGEVLPVFQSKCGGSLCHGGALGAAFPAVGLLLTSPEGVSATALGRVAEESNTGPLEGPGVSPQAPPKFGRDMPILDNFANVSGNPGNSWLLYKLLMAAPSAPPSALAHALSWQPMSNAERGRLSGRLPGREMPYADGSPPPLGPNAPAALTSDELEGVSRWIAEGAPVPAVCP